MSSTQVLIDEHRRTRNQYRQGIGVRASQAGSPQESNDKRNFSIQRRRNRMKGHHIDPSTNYSLPQISRANTPPKHGGYKRAGS